MNIYDKAKRLVADRYIGNKLQVGGTRHYRLTEGGTDGTRCIDVRTGSGFEYTVVLDRGMDISLASYKGTNLVYLTEEMETNPSFYDPWETEWLRTFSAGLLTTCGPTYLSSPCIDEGEKLGQHGRWACLPGKQISGLTNFEDGKIEIQGDIYDSVPFGNKIKIHRTIKSEFGKSSVIIEDNIKNEGGCPAPLNVLYHINFGYPLLCESTTVYVPSEKCTGYDEYSNERMNEQKSVKSPDGNNLEKNYLHTFSENEDEKTVMIHNKDLDGGLAVYITFNPKRLPYMTQWVLENVKDYVLALEPANVPCEPRSVLREMGIFPILNPGETTNFRVEIGVISGNENIEKYLTKIK